MLRSSQLKSTNSSHFKINYHVLKRNKERFLTQTEQNRTVITYTTQLDSTISEDVVHCQ